MTDDTSDRSPEGAQPPKDGLPEPVREHLGQELRAAFNRTAPKPAYLGDPALPPEFEHQLLRLDATLDVREKGVEAVAKALDLSGAPEEET